MRCADINMLYNVKNLKGKFNSQPGLAAQAVVVSSSTLQIAQTLEEDGTIHGQDIHHTIEAIE
jgi:hypothetical protein